LEEIVAAPVKKTENTTGGSVALTTQHPLSAKVGSTSPRSGCRSVGIVRYLTKAKGFFFLSLDHLQENAVSVFHLQCFFTEHSVYFYGPRHNSVLVLCRIYSLQQNTIVGWILYFFVLNCLYFLFVYLLWESG
jgi:hypothetical protein